MKQENRFDEIKHEYWRGNIRLLSVNQILELAGYDYKFTNQSAMDKGKSAHKTIELAIRGLLDKGALDPILADYLSAFEMVSQDLGLDIIETEQQIYSKKYPIAGTFDILAIVNNKLTIIDLKTGQPNLKRERLQTAGYMSIYNEDRASIDCVEQRMIIYLKNATYSILTENEKDVDIFKACIKIAFYKIN